MPVFSIMLIYVCIKLFLFSSIIICILPFAAVL